MNDNFARIILKYKKDPELMVWEQFKVKPDAWQSKVLRAFPDPTKRRIAMRACVGPGKTAVLAWLGLNFLLCYGGSGEHPKGACVSITEDNLKSALWPEFAKWIQQSPLLNTLFIHTKEMIFSRHHPKDWFLMARAFSQKADKATLGRTLSGIHSPYTLFLLDETGEMPIEILQAAEQALSTGKWCKIIMAGNPMSLDGALYHACVTQGEKYWDITRITADPEDPDRTPRIDINWAREQIALYPDGRTNPWVMYSILGEFPPSSINQLIGPEEVMEAMNREIHEDAFKFSDRRYGIDVARFGDDRTMIRKRQGLAMSKPIMMRNARTNEIAELVSLDDGVFESDVMAVDDTGGYGAGVIDHLLLLGKSPMPINFSAHATDQDHFYNRRSEMIWNFVQWIKRGGVLPLDLGLKKELLAHSYTIQKGKVRVEEKEQVKAKLKGLSPDDTDACALTFSVPDGLRRRGGRQSVGKASMDYDVLEERDVVYKGNTDDESRVH